MTLAAWIFWTCWLMIAYSYCLFPLLLGAAAHLFGRVPGNRRRVEICDAAVPSVALIVAAHNEEHWIERKLRNSLGVDYPPDRLEVWIGSDGSTDGTARIAGAIKDPRVRFFDFKQRRGKQSVLTDLVRECRAEILVFSDANSMLDSTAVRRLVEHFADPEVGIVSGEVVLDHAGGPSGEGLYWKYECWIKSAESRLGLLMGCNGGLFAVRRELFRPLPADTIVEDFVLTLRVLQEGWQARFDRAARALEPPAPSARAEMVRKVRIGAGGFQALGLTWPLLLPSRGWVAFAYWGHKVLRWLTPPLALTATVANTALLGEPFYAAFLACVLAGVTFGERLYRHESQFAIPGWVRAVGYFYLMNWALFLGLLRWLRGSQQVTWERVGR